LLAGDAGYSGTLLLFWLLFLCRCSSWIWTGHKSLPLLWGDNCAYSKLYSLFPLSSCMPPAEWLYYRTGGFGVSSIILLLVLVLCRFDSCYIGCA